MSTDLTLETKYCGTCVYWQGERKYIGSSMRTVRVMSARGDCSKQIINKNRTLGNTCSSWTPMR